MRKIALGSKLLSRTEDQATGLVTERYYVAFEGGGCTSPSFIPAGTAVLVQEKKAGTQYVDSLGVVQKVRKDGFNLDIIIGNASQVRMVSETAKALAELV